MIRFICVTSLFLIRLKVPMISSSFSQALRPFSDTLQIHVHSIVARNDSLCQQLLGLPEECSLHLLWLPLASLLSAPVAFKIPNQYACASQAPPDPVDPQQSNSTTFTALSSQSFSCWQAKLHLNNNFSSYMQDNRQCNIKYNNCLVLYKPWGR